MGVVIGVIAACCYVWGVRFLFNFNGENDEDSAEDTAGDESVGERFVGWARQLVLIVAALIGLGMVVTPAAAGNELALSVSGTTASCTVQDLRTEGRGRHTRYTHTAGCPDGTTVKVDTAREGSRPVGSALPVSYDPSGIFRAHSYEAGPRTSFGWVVLGLIAAGLLLPGLGWVRARRQAHG